MKYMIGVALLATMVIARGSMSDVLVDTNPTKCTTADVAMVLALDDSSSVDADGVDFEKALIAQLDSREVLEIIEDGFHGCVLLKALTWADWQYRFNMTDWHKVYNQSSLTEFVRDAIEGHPRGIRFVGSWTQAYFGVRMAQDSFLHAPVPANRYAVIIVPEGMTTVMELYSQESRPSEVDLTHLYDAVGWESLNGAVQVHAIVFGDDASEIEHSYRAWLTKFGGMVRIASEPADAIEVYVATIGQMMF
jgi:hypothetical protein